MSDGGGGDSGGGDGGYDGGNHGGHNSHNYHNNYHDNDYHDDDNDNRRGNCDCKRITFWILLPVAIITLIAGIACLSTGITEQKSANQMNPSVDFTSIEGSCEIAEAILLASETRMCSRKEGDRDVSYECGCDDVYAYTISAPALATVDDFYIQNSGGNNYQYQSRKHNIDRDGTKNCYQGTVSPPKFNVGETVDCWHPSDPSEKTHKNYKCGNDECIKIFSPFDEAKDANDRAQAFWIAGIVLLVFSFFPNWIIVICLRKSACGGPSPSSSTTPSTTITNGPVTVLSPNSTAPPIAVPASTYNHNTTSNSTPAGGTGGAILFSK